MRLRRVLLGLSQDKLAEKLGLTFQQVQKYERGVNRISSGRLFYLAQVLGVPVSFFYEDLPGVPPSRASDTPSAASPPGIDPGLDAMMRTETLELVRAYYRIPAVPVRRKIGELIRSIAGPDPDQKRRGRPPKRGDQA
jgi:transcriptional regulator with XRE-family HTH domain